MPEPLTTLVVLSGLTVWALLCAAALRSLGAWSRNRPTRPDSPPTPESKAVDALIRLLEEDPEGWAHIPETRTDWPQISHPDSKTHIHRPGGLWWGLWDVESATTQLTRQERKRLTTAAIGWEFNTARRRIEKALNGK